MRVKCINPAGLPGFISVPDLRLAGRVKVSGVEKAIWSTISVGFAVVFAFCIEDYWPALANYRVLRCAQNDRLCFGS